MVTQVLDPSSAVKAGCVWSQRVRPTQPGLVNAGAAQSGDEQRTLDLAGGLDHLAKVQSATREVGLRGSRLRPAPRSLGR